MSDIPSEVFQKILVQLPAVSLYRFRIVCKTWRDIIDDPSFIKAHANNQVYSHTLLVRNETGAPLYYFSLDSLNFADGPQKIEATRIKQLIRPGVPRLRDLCDSRPPSCNGLILLTHENIKKIWAIWNPLTGECHELPQPNASLNVKDFACGLGYDYHSDDYKVVRIDRLFFPEKVVYQTLVYSMKSGLWSMVEGCPKFWYLFDTGAFLNGILYWKSLGCILAFDLRTESYFRLPIPKTNISGNNGNDLPSRSLDELDGCLIYSVSSWHHFDGWVMQDNGVKKFWVKLFSIQSFELEGTAKLVAYLKSKRQIVLQHRFHFLWFDIENNSVLKFSIHGFPYINSSQVCSGSLVRLNASGSTVGSGAITSSKTSTRKRKKKCKETYTSLTICVREVEDACCCSDMWETLEDDD